MCLLYEFGILLAQLIERFLGKRVNEEAGALEHIVPGAAEMAGRPDQTETEQKQIK